VIVEAARDEGIQLDQLNAVLAGGNAVFEDVVVARRVLGRAAARWRKAAPSWKRLNFAMQHQQQDQWCWAATSVSVAAFYEPNTRWTQCAIVNAEKGLSTCCEDGTSAACNQPNVLDGPLSRVALLDHMQAGSVAYGVLGGEIDAGHPVAWRIGWSGGGGHFAVIEGYQSSGAEWIAVDDPWYGPSDLAVSTLSNGTYQGSGSWTHTYFTRPRPTPRPVPTEVSVPWDVWERVRAEMLVVEAERP
jgi:hypothetical protein